MSESHGQKSLGWKKLLAKVLVLLIAAGLVAFTQDWGKLWGIFKQINVWVLLLATFFFVISGFVIAIRWYWLLRSQEIDVGLGPAVKVNFLGLFYNNFLLSSIGGDVLRAWYITRHTHKRLEAVFSVLIDRLIGLVTIMLMALIATFLVPIPAFKGSQVQRSAEKGGIVDFVTQNPGLLLGVLIVAIVLGLALFLVPAVRLKFKTLVGRVTQKRKQVWEAIVLYCKSPITIVSAIIFTFFSQGITVLGLYFIGRSLGFEIAARHYFVIFPVGWVVASLPLSPGGLGVFELGLVAMFSMVEGGSEEIGLTLALCQRLIFLLGSFPGIFIHISGAHLPELKEEFSIDSRQVMD